LPGPLWLARPRAKAADAIDPFSLVRDIPGGAGDVPAGPREIAIAQSAPFLRGRSHDARRLRAPRDVADRGRA
jgi:hypothetical protein